MAVVLLTTIVPVPGSISAAMDEPPVRPFQLDPPALNCTSAVPIAAPLVFVNRPSICTVTVIDTGAGSPAPTATVTFTRTGGPGPFAGSPCTIPGTEASPSCTFTFAQKTRETAS